MTETTLLITFSLPLKLEETTHFRGAVLNAISGEKDILLHNHQEDSLRYAYPLVQYKSIDGRAAILCIDQGVEKSGTIMQACNRILNIGKDRIHERLVVESLLPAQTDIKIGDTHRYLLGHWLPLTDKNLKDFNDAEDPMAKVAILERALVGHILSFAKGIGVFFEGRVMCRINEVHQCESIHYKNMDLAAFDVDFVCNVSLPNYIGLGKHTSVGYGTITEIE